MEVTISRSASPAQADAEIVERKGIGHPDTICDGLAEEICRALCHAYVERFGAILHHNVDKILLRGGAARPAFGGGEILEPIEFCLAGRAVEEYQGRKIPVAEIAIEASRSWLRLHLPGLNLDHDVRLFPKFRPGSGELRSLFSKGSAIPLSNDTSCGAGFAPLTPLERVVLEVERTLNSQEVKLAYPAIGQDIKVMGIRRRRGIALIIGCAMIGRCLDGIEDYKSVRDAALETAVAIAREITDLKIAAEINAADDIGAGELFLTVTGTSAEAGDDGEVGRGNRVSGLITPCRRMTLEAAAGKNPFNHVGKLYSVAATRISERITAQVHEVESASCLLVSQIGRRIDDPQIADVQVSSKADTEGLAEPIEAIVRDELGHLGQIREELLAGRISVY